MTRYVFSLPPTIQYYTRFTFEPPNSKSKLQLDNVNRADALLRKTEKKLALWWHSENALPSCQLSLTGHGISVKTPPGKTRHIDVKIEIEKRRPGGTREKIRFMILYRNDSLNLLS